MANRIAYSNLPELFRLVCRSPYGRTSQSGYVFEIFACAKFKSSASNIKELAGRGDNLFTGCESFIFLLGLKPPFLKSFDFPA
jgi:hypothetical protein